MGNATSTVAMRPMTAASDSVFDVVRTQPQFSTHPSASTTLSMPIEDGGLAFKLFVQNFAYASILWAILPYKDKNPPNLDGACGYGEYGRTINDGCVAVASPSKLYRDGAGCGACYQVRCKAAERNEEGVTVVVTDQGGGPDTDFILSAPAFTKMAQPGGEKQLMVYGKVDIEYQRVPCRYPGKTLMLKVTEHSRYDYYLSLEFLYQSGTSDITVVEILEEETLSWRPCQRSYGAVWDLSNPPKGALTVRFFLAGTATVKARWVLVPTVIPAVWQPGVAYDTSITLGD